MYEIEVKTPEGIFIYKENIENIDKVIQEHPDYEEIKAKQIKEK